MSLCGTPLWIIAFAVAIFAADIAWRIRKGKIGGAASVVLAVLARFAFCGYLLAANHPHAGYGQWVLSWLLFLLLWLLLDKQSERLKRPLSREARPGAA